MSLFSTKFKLAIAYDITVGEGEKNGSQVHNHMPPFAANVRSHFIYFQLPFYFCFFVVFYAHFVMLCTVHYPNCVPIMIVETRYVNAFRMP